MEQLSLTGSGLFSLYVTLAACRQSIDVPYNQSPVHNSNSFHASNGSAQQHEIDEELDVSVGCRICERNAVLVAISKAGFENWTKYEVRVDGFMA